MKKNMQKVPTIQQRSNEFHQSEAQQADALLETTLADHKDTTRSEGTSSSPIKQKQQRLSRRRRLWLRVRTLL